MIASSPARHGADDSSADAKPLGNSPLRKILKFEQPANLQH